MAIAISIKDIFIFKYLPPSVLQELKTHFRPVELTDGEKFIQAGEKMLGVYLVVEGQVEVYTESFQELIVTLGTGATIGEMSLLEKDGMASASIKAGSKGARLVGCSREIFEEKILNDEFLAYRFYKGACELLSGRLRKTNQVVNQRIETAKESIKNILDDYYVISRIENVKGAVDEAGADIVSCLGDAVKGLGTFIDEHPEWDLSSVEKVKLSIEKVMFEDMQGFDQAQQKLGIIIQFLENVQFSLSSEETKEVKGDLSLFRK